MRLLGKTRQDKVKNGMFREQLQVKPIKQKIGERQLAWPVHVKTLS